MKIHLVISSEPPQFGTTLRAECGAQIPSAQPIRSEDGEMPRETILFCRKCQEKLLAISYVAWIISGEESKQLEGKN